MKTYRTYITILLIALISTVLVFETHISSIRSATTSQESNPETSKESRCYNYLHHTGIRSVLSQIDKPGISTNIFFRNFVQTHPEQFQSRGLHSRKYITAAAHSTALRI